MTAIAHDRPIDQMVSIETNGGTINADWSVPLRPRGTVMILNGAGCSRFARRNRSVARQLYDEGFATLILDMFTDEEEREDALTGALRLDLELMSSRIAAATRWLSETEVAHLPVGQLTSGVATAAALLADARSPGEITAIVSRGGRPDLAGIKLYKVAAPVMLVVGDNDIQGIELNRWALRRINSEKSLVTVPDGTHHLDDPGSLASMTKLATNWFKRVMKAPSVKPTSIFSLNWTDRKRHTFA